MSCLWELTSRGDPSSFSEFDYSNAASHTPAASLTSCNRLVRFLESIYLVLAVGTRVGFPLKKMRDMSDIACWMANC